jgi:ABC-2 type transport system permease protein
VPPLRRFGALAGLAGAYLRVNLQSALEYRVSFVSQIFSMLLNDLLWLFFWLFYFGRFRLVGGWGRQEIVTLWAVVAVGFGLATALCGNLFRIAGIIVRGELDLYLSLPKPVLPHLLISRMSLTALGDIAFGVLVFGILTRPSPAAWLLFVLFTITTASVFIGFGIITQSLTFWLGNGEGVAQQLVNAMISFSTYPTIIFHGWVKVALFTVIPAGFVAYVPVRLLQQFSWGWLVGLLAFCAGILGGAGLVFHTGLRRYESGNLITIKE